MTETVKSFDPNLLLEASRVMNAAGPEYAKATQLISGWAVQNAAKAAPATRAAILGDAAALSLRKGDYKAALARLEEIGSMDYPDPDDRGRLYMLRALANGQEYKEKSAEGISPRDNLLTALRQSIREDLAAAFNLDKNAKQQNARYWGLLARHGPERSGVVEDDLHAAFADADLEDSQPLVTPDEELSPTGLRPYRFSQPDD